MSASTADIAPAENATDGVTAEPSADAPPAVPDGAACALHPDADATFVCQRCGTFGCAACRFAEVEGHATCRACADKGLGEPIPWERREELGNWRAFFRTVHLASRFPTRFFRTPKTTASVIGALVHATLTSTIGVTLAYLIAGILVMIGGGATAAFAPPDVGDVLGSALGIYGCVLVGMTPLALLMTPANAILTVVYSAVAAHGTLALAKKARGSFTDTLRAVSYANAPYVWQWIPVIGIVTWPWMIAVEAIAMRETHRCGTDWAVGAVLAHRIVVALLFIAMYVAMGGAMFALMAGQTRG